LAFSSALSNLAVARSTSRRVIGREDEDDLAVRRLVDELEVRRELRAAGFFAGGITTLLEWARTVWQRCASAATRGSVRRLSRAGGSLLTLTTFGTMIFEYASGPR